MLGAPHPVDRFVEMFGDVEAVMNNLGLRHLGPGRRFESRAHVHDDGFHILTLFKPYTFEKPLGTGLFPFFGDFQYPRAFSDRSTPKRNSVRSKSSFHRLPTASSSSRLRRSKPRATARSIMQWA
jgi:hypothetical protein